MPAIPITTLSRDGITPPAQVSDSQTTMTLEPRDRRTWFEVTNTAAVTRTVVIDTPATVDGLAIADVTITLPAGATRIVGPFGTTYGGTVNMTVPGTNEMLFRGYYLAPG